MPISVDGRTDASATPSMRRMDFTGLSQESGVPFATLRTFYQVLVDTFAGSSFELCLAASNIRS